MIRISKSILYRFNIPGILIPHKSFTFLGYLSQLSSWISDNKKDLGYGHFPSSNFAYQRRYELYTYLINDVIKCETIDYFEFGVAQGSSFKWWVSNHMNPGSRFYGFDTFTGLPEDWGPFKKGAMSNGNKPPEIEDKRHHFYQGIFQDTLPSFLNSYESKNKKVIHLDADLFSSTLFVLTSMSHLLKKGDLIIFDEFNVPLHEFRAFSIWVESFYIKYKVIGQNNNFYQMALTIE